jgi:hypothetical protein
MDILVRAVAAHRAGEMGLAEELYRRVLEHGENYDALGNLGLVVGQRGDPAQAEDLFLRAIRLRPDKPAHRLNLGRLYRRLARLDDAAGVFEAVLAAHPDNDQARHALGDIYLAQGRHEGWELYGARDPRANAPARQLPYPEWAGEPLAGRRLFVMSEQGFGDQIFAARFVKALSAGHVTFACAPELAGLFAQLPVEILPRTSRYLTIPRHDYWTQPLSLPRWAAPAQAPYLAAPRPDRRGRIGVVWRGNDKPDPHRSLPAELARRLLALPGAVSLQPEDSGAADFQATAAIMAGLELVISIDTSAAHLAGALGRPGVVLLQHLSTDWRWRAAGDDPARSYWYPSLELLRQPAPGDWLSVIEALEQRLG